MNKDRLLLALVVADVFLAFGVMGSEWIFHWTLPAELQEHASHHLASPDGFWGLCLFALWTASVATTLVAWVGLLNHWSVARPLYVFAWGTWTLLGLLSGPTVMTSMGATLDTLETIVGGMIIALVYFSDLAQAFERRATAPQAAVHMA